jgi:hypothetical protein
MESLFNASSSFASLSLRDLIDAREVFHYHLLTKKNVVATALGPYRIRKDDPWPDREHPKGHPTPAHRGKRTLFNSEVRPYSWPSIYVFVSQWEDESVLAKGDPADVVPKRIYLPDGRVVPICVIEAKRQPYATDLKVDPRQMQPRNVLAPGVPLINEDAQGIQRIGTAGCLVKDGEMFYVLTNRHVAGPEGTAISALNGHRSVAIGTTSSKGITRLAFKEVYPHFTSTFQYLLMDVGLVEVADIQRWTTQFSEIAPVDNVLDLYDNSFSLHLIGMNVVGLGAVTGLIRGEIHGLFYRYKSIGGYEYLADFLVGPDTTTQGDAGDAERGLSVLHGDSGALLFIEYGRDDNSPCRYYPFGILWGKHEFVEDDSKTAQPFALATALSTVLERLNLDLVRDLNLDDELIWGWVGHYVIGNTLPNAIKLLASPQLPSLNKFVAKHQSLLSMEPSHALDNDPRVIKKTNGKPKLGDPQFVPLADVPDNVWKSNVNFYQTVTAEGKRQRHPGPGSRGQADNPNHFADVDLPYKGFDTFLAFVLSDVKTNLEPAVWLDYYNSVAPKFEAWAKALGKEPRPKSHWGALPFRVWQLYKAMRAAAEAGDAALFLCAGGVLIHYVGDACQPLHTSFLSQGDPDDLVDKPRSEGQKMRADGVHSGYEDDMINYGFQKEGLFDAIEQEIKRQGKDHAEKLVPITTSKNAAELIVRLAAKTHETIHPRDIVDAWVDLKPLKKRDRTVAMWERFGEKTVQCMARGSRCLTHLWAEAWVRGGGDTNIGSTAKVTKTAIRNLYDDAGVLRSVSLDRYRPLKLL